MSEGWLSAHPSKRWAERFVLLYSPVWIALVAVVQLGQILDPWGDLAYLVFGVLLAAPLVVVPLIWPGAADRGRPLRERHWVKLNLWLAIFTWCGSYFITHYFFEALGMAYRFPVTWTFDAVLPARMHDTAGKVPIFLYFMTQAYFATYHVVMVVLYRRVARVVTSPWLRGVAVLAISYVVAFAETWAMANPLLERYFEYADRAWMLRVGSTAYATLFVVSLPLIARIDETANGAPEPHRWPLRRVALEACAASFLALQLIDLWVHAVA